MVHVGKYSIHGAAGLDVSLCLSQDFLPEVLGIFQTVSCFGKGICLPHFSTDISWLMFSRTYPYKCYTLPVDLNT